MLRRHSAGGSSPHHHPPPPLVPMSSSSSSSVTFLDSRTILKHGIPPQKAMPLFSLALVILWSLVFVAAPFYLLPLVLALWIGLGVMQYSILERGIFFLSSAAFLYALHRPFKSARDLYIWKADHEYFSTVVVIDKEMQTKKDADDDADDNHGEEETSSSQPPSSIPHIQTHRQRHESENEAGAPTVGTRKTYNEEFNFHGPAIIVCFPHGIYPFAMGLALTGIISKYLGPPAPRVVAAGAAVNFPVFGLPVKWLHPVPADSASIRFALEQQGSRLLLNPGGIAEIFLNTNTVSPMLMKDSSNTMNNNNNNSGSGKGETYISPVAATDDCEIIMLRKRKGFIKLAIQTGTPLIPMYVFGQSQLFHLFGFCRSGWFERISRYVRASLVFFYGRFGLPIPFRVPLLYVIGPPILVPQPPARASPASSASQSPSTTTTSTTSISTPSPLPSAAQSGLSSFLLPRMGGISHSISTTSLSSLLKLSSAKSSPPAAAAAGTKTDSSSSSSSSSYSPPQELIDEYHEKLMNEIKRLFDKYKAAYDPSWKNKQLVIV